MLHCFACRHRRLSLKQGALHSLAPLQLSPLPHHPRSRLALLCRQRMQRLPSQHPRGQGQKAPHSRAQQQQQRLLNSRRQAKPSPPKPAAMQASPFVVSSEPQREPPQKQMSRQGMCIFTEAMCSSKHCAINVGLQCIMRKPSICMLGSE